MRDYCQHGEPMDEHCPQCKIYEGKSGGHSDPCTLVWCKRPTCRKVNTKAAANDSATAHVPAGGTPEGLAREKVEMTDSEVKPRGCDPIEVVRQMVDDLYDEGATLESREELQAIVDKALAAARDEGRREAVPLIDAVRIILINEVPSDEAWRDLNEAYDAAVAGLNASEPQEPTND